MKKVYLLSFFLIISFSFKNNNGHFKSQQLKFSRVRAAYKNQEGFIKQLFKEKHIQINEFNLYLRVFKSEGIVEAWVKKKQEKNFVLLKKYVVCSSSGILGPKRQAGDGQVPEGFYHIDRFNPFSNFHLSLGISYPNNSDKILSSYKDKGGDIFIHGNCVTIGCIPISDEPIEELYLLAVEAKNNGQNEIRVDIFPCKLTFSLTEQLLKNSSNKPKTIEFWKNLKEGYDYFETKKILPKIIINQNGKYLFD